MWGLQNWKFHLRVCCFSKFFGGNFSLQGLLLESLWGILAFLSLFSLPELTRTRIGQCPVDHIASHGNTENISLFNDSFKQDRHCRFLVFVVFIIPLNGRFYDFPELWNLQEYCHSIKQNVKVLIQDIKIWGLFSLSLQCS